MSRSRSITRALGMRNNNTSSKSRSPSKGPEWQRMVTRDGRVFFVNNVTQETSWLHPRTGQPELTGNFHYKRTLSTHARTQHTRVLKF